MTELAVLLPFLTFAEVIALKYSKRVDSPKHIWFPIAANIIGAVVITVFVILAVLFFAAGFVVAFGEGY